MTERREYDEATKAAVMAALLAGQSVGQVASQYKIPKGTVKYWKSQLPSTNLVDPQKRERIGALVLDNLEAQLVATKAMADVFADKTWIEKQSASEIAVLFGVVSDKTFRLLEALPDEEPEEAE